MNKYTLVTGGAGFIGSHLIDYLILKLNKKVICIDNLALGSEENIKHLYSNNLNFYNFDVNDKMKIEKIFQEFNIEEIFHFAANSDIKKGSTNVMIDFNNTFLSTLIILKMMKKYNIKKIVFASSSAIYGDHQEKLSENSGPLFPNSFYGSSKLSSEAYITAMSSIYNIQSWIVRFPNVVGSRCTHGVIFDFLNKLEKNNQSLHILGDGKQEKPYIYVKDLIDAIFFIINKSNNNINCFNISSLGRTTVNNIADIIIKELNLNNVKITYSGGKVGWIGDIPKFEYDTTKLINLGWKNARTSNDSVMIAVKDELEFRKNK